MHEGMEPLGSMVTVACHDLDRLIITAAFAETESRWYSGNQVTAAIKTIKLSRFCST